MILDDIPEKLIVSLTAVLFWLGARDWMIRRRKRN
jgi:hypothetical protein